MKTTRITLITAALFLVGLIVGPAAAQAVDYTTTIYFNSGKAGVEGPGTYGQDAYSVRPTGRNDRLITRSAQDLTACERGKLAYVFSKPGYSNDEVWVMDSDGRDKERLTRGKGDATDPAFSPSCKRIVFTREGDIWAVGIRGGEAKRLLDDDKVSGAGRLYAPSYSPDGERIVFSGEGTGIYSMELEGRKVTQITTDDDWDPVYAPSGKTIAFQRIVTLASGATSGEIFTIRTNGSRLRQITDDDHLDAEPAFSPDGVKLAYTHYTEFMPFGEEEEPMIFEVEPAIVIADSVDGEPSRELTKVGFNPTWVKN